jgi:hypothetical protein
MTDAAIVPAATADDALGRILGTGDVATTMGAIERFAQDVIDLARARGFTMRFGDGPEWLAEPAWALIRSVMGAVTAVEATSPIDGGFKARAITRRLDGPVIASAEAICLRGEPGKARMTDHALLATAQTRARRNSDRAAFGGLLVLAGWDISDPSLPATRKQVVALHTLAGRHGWSHAESHTRASVESFRDLNREQAAELIDRWSALEDAEAPDESAVEVASGEPPSEAQERPPQESTAGLGSTPGPSWTIEEAREHAIDVFGSKVKAMQAFMSLFEPGDGLVWSAITLEQFHELVDARSDGLV